MKIYKTKLLNNRGVILGEFSSAWAATAAMLMIADSSYMCFKELSVSDAFAAKKAQMLYKKHGDEVPITKEEWQKQMRIEREKFNKQNTIYMQKLVDEVVNG